MEANPIHCGSNGWPDCPPVNSAAFPTVNASETPDAPMYSYNEMVAHGEKCHEQGKRHE